MLGYTGWYIATGNKKKKTGVKEIKLAETLLQSHIPFYKKLNESEKQRFAKEVNDFLSGVAITPVNTAITDADRIMVAASAVIPMFSFPGWVYPNLEEVLVYNDTFNMDFQTHTLDRNIMGMVGTGVYKNKMLVSKPALQAGFSNSEDSANTAIHEFVHLIDAADGDTDGVPEILMDKKYALPWMNLIHDEMEKMRDGNSDINPYGYTNKSEFFAVASEYFFECPELFEERHPALFQMMDQVFRMKEKALSS
jgi:Mlc titration factor MtfA (ptsG expression regulator)